MITFHECTPPYEQGTFTPCSDKPHREKAREFEDKNAKMFLHEAQCLLKAHLLKS